MLEIEIKLRIGKPADVESRLRALGAHCEVERAFEDNILYDHADRPLTGAGRMLRLRRDAAGTLLTFKDTAVDDAHAKVRREIETRLTDFDAMESILRALGLEPLWRYQKYRTAYRLGRLHALIDELPIGNFLELEGSHEEIDRWAGALGFARGDYLATTYRDLYVQWRDAEGADDGDMVFPAGGGATA